MNLKLKMRILETKKPQWMVAKELNIPYWRLSNIIQERVEPTKEEIKQLTEYFGCSWAELQEKGSNNE